MIKKTLTCSLTATVINLGGLGAAQAAGFIEDAKADLTLRNIYYNSDNRSTGSNPRQEEWGQGFNLNLKSGFTQGQVGFGLDALGLLGVRLDGGGTAGSNGRGTTRNPSGNPGQGNLFPVDSNNQAVTDFSSLGLTAKMRLSNTDVRIGTLQPRLPVVMYNDGRLLPQTFEGGQITSKEIDGLMLTAGQLSQGKGRASSDNTSLSMSGAQQGADTDKFYFAGGDYNFTPNLIGQYYYGKLEDFYNQHFLGLTYTLDLPAGSLKSDLRYWYNDSDGKNSSSVGRSQGYLASGYFGRTVSGSAISRGEVDNQTWSAAFTYSLSGHAVTLGYQQVEGNSDFSFINQGDVYRGSGGAYTYLITDRQITNFAHAGENTWLAQYAYDFASAGVPGLTTSVVYLKGDNIDSAQGSLTEWERDIALTYVVQGGPFKGVGIAWRNAALRSDSISDIDQNRLILSYSIPLI